jgi:hypothetical protein
LKIKIGQKKQEFAYSDVVFVHKTNRKMLEWAGALCWFEPETLSAEELKKRGNTAFVKDNFEGILLLYSSNLIFF